MTDQQSHDSVPELAHRRIQLLDRYFFNRRDQAAALMGWGKPHPIIAEDNLPGLLRAHVMGPAAPAPGSARYQTKRGALKVESGHFRLGSYTPDLDGSTRWVCLDFDGPGHSDALDDPEGAVRATHANFGAAGIPAYLERSGGGKGYHLWVFFSQPIPAKLGRRLARTLAPDNLRLARGGVAVPRSNRGVEIFPKVDRLKKPSQLGNLVWLPWYHGAPAGANQFYREDNGTLLPYEPDSFETMSQDAVEQALAVAGTAEPEDMAVEKFLRRANKQDDSQRPPSSAWREWKEKALALLPLERVYGDLLTGATSGDHWLQCRDPDSPSGEQSRSGNVADGGGDALRGTFHSWRTNETLSVFDFMVQRGLAKDFQDAARQVAEMTGVQLPVRGTVGNACQRPPGAKGKPVVVTNLRQLEDIILDAVGAIDAANARPVPTVYSLTGRPAHLIVLDGKPEIELLDDTGMYGILARLADWVRRSEDGDAAVFPPHEVARDLIRIPPRSLPPIDRIVTAPVFDADGRLIEQPGYDRASGTWYHRPDGLEIPPVPPAPSPADIVQAKAILLDELLVDFPFVSPSDRAHALAALVLPFVRRMIDGPTPVHLYEAPAPGSGKTLLGEVVCIVATGDKAEPTTVPRDGEELRKKLLSLLLARPQVILLDNVSTGIDCGHLASVLTAEKYQDRILGVSAMGCPPNRTCWLLTANNAAMTLEIARRSVRVRIEPAQERPWERQGFKHWPLKPWVAQHRGEIVHALLTLVQGWVAQGRPAGSRTLGSFEAWAAVIGGILEAAAIPGLLENSADLYEAADLEGQEWQEFVTTWWEEHGASPVAAGVLQQLANDRGMLASVLGGKSDRSQAIRLGKTLRQNRNRRFGAFRIEASRGRTNQNLWKLARVDDDVPPSGPGGGESREPGGELFPPSKAGMQEVPTPTSCNTSCTATPSKMADLQEVQEVQEVFPPLARGITHADARTSAPPPTLARGQPPLTSCNILHILQTQENQGGGVQEVGAGSAAGCSSLPALEPVGPLDLAHLDELDEEEWP